MDKQDFKGIITFKTAEDYNAWRAGTFTKGGEDFPAYNRNILAVLPDEQSQYVETGIEKRVEQLEANAGGKLYEYTICFTCHKQDEPATATKDYYILILTSKNIGDVWSSVNMNALLELSLTYITVIDIQEARVVYGQITSANKIYISPDFLEINYTMITNLREV